MKLKYFLSGFTIILTVISAAQIFMVPPYAGDIYRIYKSGYYRELDTGFSIIRDAFLNIKSMSDPGSAWIFVRDMGKKYGITVRIYDHRGMEKRAPGEPGISGNEDVLNIINSPRPSAQDKIVKDRYLAYLPVTAEKECRFCHKNRNTGDLLGVMSFERDHDSHIYYSSERVIIFIFVTLILLIFLFSILRWNPGKKIQEMFDN